MTRFRVPRPSAAMIVALFVALGQTVHVEVLQGSGVSLNARILRFEIVFVGR